MTKMLRYQVNPGLNTVELRKGAKVLSFATKNDGLLNFWARSDPEEKTETREFFVSGTGWTLEAGFEGKNLNFIGTAVSGAYVWHLFEVVDKFKPVGPKASE